MSVERVNEPLLTYDRAAGESVDEGFRAPSMFERPAPRIRRDSSRLANDASIPVLAIADLTVVVIYRCR